MRLIDVDGINDFYIDFSSYKECPDEDDVKAWLDEQPTIEEEPVRHGEWVIVDATSYDDVCTCSECGGFAPSGFIKSNYCPKCGAKMDGKEKEE